MPVSEPARDRATRPARTGTLDGPRTDLTRMTCNLNPRAVMALNAIAAESGGNRTDVVNVALRLTAALLPLARPDGTVHVTGPDGDVHIVHLP